MTISWIETNRRSGRSRLMASAVNLSMWSLSA
nr:MAG TPA: hypothetical protein [Caudoviricetes sp.]